MSGKRYCYEDIVSFLEEDRGTRLYLININDMYCVDVMKLPNENAIAVYDYQYAVRNREKGKSGCWELINSVFDIYERHKRQFDKWLAESDSDNA